MKKMIRFTSKSWEGGVYHTVEEETLTDPERHDLLLIIVSGQARIQKKVQVKAKDLVDDLQWSESTLAEMKAEFALQTQTPEESKEDDRDPELDSPYGALGGCDTYKYRR